MRYDINRLKLDAATSPAAANELLRAAQRRGLEALIALAWTLLWGFQKASLSAVDGLIATRGCAHCGRELTDPASRNHGVGPVCRKRRNDVLARTMPADLAAAVVLVGSARGLMGRVNSAVAPLVLAAFDQLEHAADAARAKRDWRDVVSVFEVTLSYGDLGCDMRRTLEEITEALGYVALVALWRGEVVKGKASLAFDAERGALILTSPFARNRALRDIIAKSGGFRWQRRNAYVWPATHVDAAQNLINNHWLALDQESAAQAFEAANAWTAPANHTAPTCWQDMENARPRQARTPHFVRPIATVTVQRDELVVHTPFNRNFINDIKNLPRRERRWDSAKRAWIVTDTQVNRVIVRALIVEHYSFDVSETIGLRPVCAANTDAEAQVA